MNYMVPWYDLSQTHQRIRPQLEDAIRRVLDKDIFIGGSEVSEFEAEYAAYMGVKHCIAVSNGLDALHLIFVALDYPAGSEVILPSNTYIASALAVSYAGLKPVLVEMDPETGLIRPENIEAAITAKTRAIMPVHLFGNACDMGAIMRIAEKHGLQIVEDNAQAQGCLYHEQNTGTFGIASGTSFYPGKNIGALGDAGAVVTNDDSMAEKIRMLQNYGSKVKYAHEMKGFNARMDTIQAAVLREKLKFLPEWNRMRKENAVYYQTHLHNRNIALLKAPFDSVWHIFPIRVLNGKRDDFREALQRKEIETLIHYPVAIPFQKAYEGDYDTTQFAATREYTSQLVSLPQYPFIPEEKLNMVCDAINAWEA